MSLEESRNQLIDAIRENAGADRIRELASIWFGEIKIWESTDEFERAYQESRMTMRAVNKDAAMKQINVKRNVNTMINLDPSVAGTIARLNQDNFLKKLKNELGLHDLSAVLLRSDIPLSKQPFKINNDTILIFMPIPLEGDLVAFSLLSIAAKSDRSSALYADYQMMRASFTRIKYGSSDDMHSGFLTISKTASTGEDDGKIHVRYGMANVMGGPLMGGILEKRKNNALTYRTTVAVESKHHENNEVIISHRNHAGLFPLFGTPTSNGIELRDKKDKKIGLLRSDGTLHA